MNRAFLVGINSYPSSPLSGCVNDVIDMSSAMRDIYHYQPSDIKIITDSGATTQAILDGLRWLVGGTTAGDKITFHYSGHGTQIPDTNGDEPDGQDECLCPVDLDWHTKIITDDTLSQILKTAPAGVIITVILDSCHSGSATRAMYGEIITTNIKYLPPPPNLKFKPTRLAKRRFGHQLQTKRDLNDVPVNLNHLLLAGCRADQTCADAYINSHHCGAFTHYLLQSIRTNPATNVIHLVDNARDLLRVAGYNQIPQLEGPADQFNRQLL